MVMTYVYLNAICSSKMDQEESKAKDLIKLAERVIRSRKFGNVCRKLDFGSDLTQDNYEIGMDPHHEFIAQQAKDLEDKYNFDFIDGKPLQDGKYGWETIDATKCEEVPDFYFRAPHRKKLVTTRIDLPQDSEMLITPGTGCFSPTGGHPRHSIPSISCSQSSHNSTHKNDSNGGKPQLYEVTSRVPNTGAQGSSTVTRKLFLDTEKVGNQDELTKTVVSYSEDNNNTISSSNTTTENRFTCESHDLNCCTSGLDLTDDFSTFTASIPVELIGDEVEKSSKDTYGSSSSNEPFLKDLDTYSCDLKNGQSLSIDIDAVEHNPPTTPNKRDIQIDDAETVSSIPILEGELEDDSSMMDTQETPLVNLADGNKRKQLLVTDCFPIKKKCVDTVRRKLYKEDSD